MSRQAAERRGRKGEAVAAWWLRLHGWRILAERVKMPMGEVDLIARKGNLVAFVEVKTRATPAEWATAIDEYRLRRVAAAANALAHRYVRDGDNLTIDVILLAPWHLPHRISNAWQPTIVWNWS